MEYHSTSGRDLWESAFRGADDVVVQPGDPNLPPPRPETDLAELTKKFVASTGPGLAPDLAVDLALQMVLHEIAEQACVSTAATGAAIVLYHDGELVCRASHGLTTPPLGARLDLGFGLSGECLRTAQIQLCNDVQTDLRVDFEVCSQLGVHSVVVLPLLRGDGIIGIFEVLSSRPSAFGEREIGQLEALADRILKNLVRASQPPATMIESASPGSNETEELHSAELGRTENSARWTDIATWALAVVVLACAGWLSTRVVQRLGWRKAAVHRSAVSGNSPTAAHVSPQSTTGNKDAAGGTQTGSNPSGALSSAGQRDRTEESSSAKRVKATASEGGLRIFDNGREVFRIRPSTEAADLPPGIGVVGASSVQSEKVLELSSSAAESALLYRVEPEYPEEARAQEIQGSVVLEVHIRPDGAVEQVNAVSGPPMLAEAAITAVKQWRFKPRQISGQRVEMQTTITLNFHLPS